MRLKEASAEEALIKVNISRRAFLPEYACILALIFILGYSRLNQIVLPRRFNYFIVALIFLIIISTELIKASQRATITASKVLIFDGLLKQTQKHIWIPSITDVDIHQNPLQRLCKYGDIHLRSASGEQTLRLRNVANPVQVLGRLEELIEKYKYTQNK
ncbi:MAG TPA: PH domain-containing protein [Candidatus Nanoarchaeia archaeon]|nr:PH domain-containing protein [Candidatus Nanoarchaeia archaeon]